MTTTTADPRTASMAKGRQADSARRRQRVITALNRAQTDGTEISVSGIARAALFTEQGREFLQLSSQVAG